MTAESGKPPPEDPAEEQPAPPEAPQFIPPAGAPPPPPPPPVPGQPPPPPPPPAPGAPQFIPPTGGGLPPPPPPGTGLPGEHGLPPPPPVGAPTFQPPSGPPAPPHPGYAQPGGPTFGPYTLASWGSRLGAYILDWLIAVVPLAFVLVIALGADTSLGWWVLAQALVFLIYFPATMMRQGARNGQTIGKQIVGIRVIREDGQALTFGTAALREFVIRYLLFNVVGSITFGIAGLLDVLWPLWDDGNRALHDMLASTRVVRA